MAADTTQPIIRHGRLFANEAFTANTALDSVRVIRDPDLPRMTLWVTTDAVGDVVLQREDYGESTTPWPNTFPVNVGTTPVLIEAYARKTLVAFKGGPAGGNVTIDVESHR